MYYKVHITGNLVIIVISVYLSLIFSSSSTHINDVLVVVIHIVVSAVIQREENKENKSYYMRCTSHRVSTIDILMLSFPTLYSPYTRKPGESQICRYCTINHHHKPKTKFYKNLYNVI